VEMLSDVSSTLTAFTMNKGSSKRMVLFQFFAGNFVADCVVLGKEVKMKGDFTMEATRIIDVRSFSLLISRIMDFNKQDVFDVI